MDNLPEFLKAAERGDLNYIKNIVEKGRDPNEADAEGHHAIHKASVSGHKEIVEYLVNEGVSVDTEGWKQKTPIQDAVWHHHPELIKYFVDNNVNCNYCDCKNETPLHIGFYRFNSCCARKANEEECEGKWKIGGLNDFEEIYHKQAKVFRKICMQFVYAEYLIVYGKASLSIVNVDGYEPLDLIKNQFNDYHLVKCYFKHLAEIEKMKPLTEGIRNIDKSMQIFSSLAITGQEEMFRLLNETKMLKLKLNEMNGLLSERDALIEKLKKENSQLESLLLAKNVRRVATPD